MEVLLSTASSNLEKSKKLCNWTSRNAVLLPPFLKKTVATDRETVAEALLKIFAKSIKYQDTENATEELDTDEDIVSDKDNKQ